MSKLMNSPLYQVIWHTRRLFQRLGATGDELLRNTPITASQRAVLEFLCRQQPQTVPQMAREKSVSRQHIQVIVNKLLEQGLVECIDNPAHARSPMIQMTTRGEKLFQRIHQREMHLFSAMESDFSAKDLLITARMLKEMDEYLQSPKWQTLLSPKSKGGQS